MWQGCPSPTLMGNCPPVGTRLLRSLAVLEHYTVPSGHLVVLRTAAPVIDLTISVADDHFLEAPAPGGTVALRLLLSPVPLPGRDRIRIRPQTTSCGLGLGLSCASLLSWGAYCIVPGIPRLYQHLTEVLAIGQLYRGDPLGRGDQWRPWLRRPRRRRPSAEGDVTCELARLRAKGLPTFRTSNPVEVHLYYCAFA